MWRAFFLAIGFYAILLGGECLVMERAVLHAKEKVKSPIPMAPPNQRQRVVQPPDWAAWTLFCFGTVTLLYSFTIPARNGGSS